MNRAKVKTKANELAELCISDIDAFAAEWKTTYESGDFTEAERDTLLPLCNIYVAYKTGEATRENTRREQHRILSIAALKEAPAE